MKILVFGRGVIGAQYGWALEKAGHQVDFYVRPGRAATYGTFINMKVFDMRKSFNGVQLNEIWPVRFLEELDVDHDYDLILLSVQHYRFSEAAAFLSSRVGKASILIFNNFWADPELAAAPLPREHLVWGFPGAGGGFSAGHTLQGGFFGQVQFGSFNPTLTAREKAVRDLMRGAGFKVVEQPDFRGWLWTHFALNAGIHAQALQAGSMARMVKVMARGKRAVLNVREVLPILEARGVRLKDFSKDVTLFQLPTWVGAAALKWSYTLHRPTRAIIGSASNPEEPKYFCRDVLVEAHRLGISVPRLEAAKPFFEITEDIRQPQRDGPATPLQVVGRPSVEQS